MIYCENWYSGEVLNFERTVAWDKDPLSVCVVISEGNKPPMVNVKHRLTKKETDFIIRYIAVNLKR